MNTTLTVFSALAGCSKTTDRVLLSSRQRLGAMYLYLKGMVDSVRFFSFGVLQHPYAFSRGVGWAINTTLLLLIALGAGLLLFLEDNLPHRSG
jgi:hypothetical protein